MLVCELLHTALPKDDSGDGVGMVCNAPPRRPEDRAEYGLLYLIAWQPVPQGHPLLRGVPGQVVRVDADELVLLQLLDGPIAAGVGVANG